MSDLDLSDQGNEAEKYYHNLVALSRVSAAISGLQDLDTILRIGLDNVLKIMNGTIGGIMLLDESTQTMSYRVYHGLSTKYAEEMHLRLGEGIAGKVAQSGRSTLLEDISSDSSAARPDLISLESLKAFISVPLRAKDNVLGVVNVASCMSHHFTKEDMHLLHSIGDQLGIAIEQARLYKRLNDARERYQILLRQALTIQEEERKRIARELHDETSQDLTALALNLQAVTEMMEMDSVENTEIKAMLKKTHTIAVHASAEVTKIIRELRPTLLDTLGLPAAVRNLAETNLVPKGINVSTELKGMDRRLSPETELSLFRIVQEAMSNVVKHSEAKSATICLECDANKCVLRVEDDGKGFNVSEITSIDQKGRGAGLFGMKERVTAAGGKCTIESKLGQGTKVIAKVPIVRSITHAEDKAAGSG
ncbi:MAG: GAF domain-containing sensor histidine kinase [Chloroflexota bacterium]|nr:GAF domain-containing sensor histidine kinase [Chloroflexota bacterium]